MAQSDNHEPIFPLLQDSLQKDPLSDAISCETILNGNGWLLRNSLTKEECKALIEVTEKRGYVNADEYCYQYRDRLNDRLMSDDHELSLFLWDRVKKFVPENISYGSTLCNKPRLNRRFRICRYIGGKNHYFGPHTDGIYPESKHSMSVVTCMFYLNDSSEFTGGLTNFLKLDDKSVTLSVKPEAGLCLIFRQNNVENCLHEGTMVEEGSKYIMRTDIIYSIDFAGMQKRPAKKWPNVM